VFLRQSRGTSITELIGGQEKFGYMLGSPLTPDSQPVFWRTENSGAGDQANGQSAGNP